MRQGDGGADGAQSGEHRVQGGPGRAPSPWHLHSACAEFPPPPAPPPALPPLPSPSPLLCTLCLPGLSRVDPEDPVQFSSVQFISVAQSCPTFATPWTAALQASLSITNSRSLLKLMSIESVMPSSSGGKKGWNSGHYRKLFVPVKTQNFCSLLLNPWDDY